ncbi:tRNA glutamyl-Q(34) synthetase GluQRS [Oceanicella actignis]|uniref:tRNA glutamyl-Q(34) synthetase GluQRS n=1 Tax=Oceanicella actignis TaxID=1189325 RepID=UPI0011E79C54|nr:tRNA glutamyl-Q(34) synthetase GluQRS [Oceanicella actignis]TYO90803.1 glutamyl-Q tRNA(Asp) synthetase [Oceanicella actignis]
MSRPAEHVERFAPSPNGFLHLGHAFSAILAHDAARAAGGRFLLRIEDIDQGRARPEYEQAIIEDLRWLGLRWDAPPMRQSQRMAVYARALDDLRARGLLYPCACTRKDIAQALAAPQEVGGAMPALPDGRGPDGPPYPGTCRRTPPAPGAPVAWRLDMRAAIAALGGASAVGRLSMRELGAGPGGETGLLRLDPDWLIARCGDVVLARKDVAASYHLAVVLDDAAQGVTHVTRGQDLFAAAPLHRLLQALFGLPVPVWRHHRLIRDAAGRRLAKRDRDAGLRELRAAGVTPGQIRRMLDLPPARQASPR